MSTLFKAFYRHSLKLKCLMIIVLHLQGYPAVRPELDLVEQEDQLTHEVSLDEEIDPETNLGTYSIFKFLFMCT